MIYNLVDVVKEYDKHEYNVLVDIVEARNFNNESMADITTMITATAEAYPELKSDQNYKQLMNELSITENLIAQHRSSYNAHVRSYNKHVKQFPNKQFLSLLGYDPIQYTYLEYDALETAPQNLFKEGN